MGFKPMRYWHNPFISAYAALEGALNNYATPLAPPGCKTIVYEQPMQQGTFEPHGNIRWYIGPAMIQIQCNTIYILKTQGECISDSATFHPHFTNIYVILLILHLWIEL